MAFSLLMFLTWKPGKQHERITGQRHLSEPDNPNLEDMGDEEEEKMKVLTRMIISSINHAERPSQCSNDRQVRKNRLGRMQPADGKPLGKEKTWLEKEKCIGLWQIQVFVGTSTMSRLQSVFHLLNFHLLCIGNRKCPKDRRHTVPTTGDPSNTANVTNTLSLFVWFRPAAWTQPKLAGLSPGNPSMLGEKLIQSFYKTTLRTQLQKELSIFLWPFPFSGRQVRFTQ